MIPLFIKLKNFGAIADAEVNFRDISLAAVVGPNGVGKSTLFTTAPLWALFGVGRSSGSDDVVKTGSGECSVIFDFEHHGHEYRIVRSRTVNGRGKSALELMKDNNGVFESISGTTIKETEEKIKGLLRIDADTFSSSSMIMQGRANEFTSKAPGQRKATLTQILGLEIYATLQERAKRKATEMGLILSRMLEDIEKNRSKIAELPDLENTIQGLEFRLKECESNMAETDFRIQESQQELFTAERQIVELGKVQSRLDELKENQTKSKYRLSVYDEKIGCIDELLRDEQLILDAVKDYEEAKEQLAVLRAKEPRREELRTRYQAIEADRVKLDQEKEGLLKNVSAIKRELENRPQIEAAVLEFEALSKRIEQDTNDVGKMRAMEGECSYLKGEIAKIDNFRSLITQKIQVCKDKVTRLDQSGCVAMDKAELNPCSFLKDAIKAKNSLPELEQELTSVGDGEELRRKLLELQGEVAILEDNAVEAKARIDRMNELKRLYEQRHKLDGMEKLLKVYEDQLSECDSRIKSFYAQLAEIKVEGQSLVDELRPISELERRMKSSAIFMTKKDELSSAREKKALIEEQRSVLLGELESIEVEIAETEQEISQIEKADPVAIKARIYTLDTQRTKDREEIASAHALLGAKRTKQKELEELKRDIAAMEDEKVPLALDLIRWEKLVAAFGKNGIPALIIENAVPELERISNEVLGQMSNGKHNLRFETQRDLKSKTGVAETLDIIVADWQGARPYETFSGGEQLRIDLAIRIGLAELLANRSGNKIEWLVIDEGLGSQDDEHRETVLDAIQSVSPRFKRTIVITHIKEAQGVFPQVIELSRVESGITVNVA